MLSHVLPGRMLPAPLIIFNEARGNIMQMSLNGAWTRPKAGSPITKSPSSSSSSLHLFSPSVLVILQFVCALIFPPLLF